MFCHVYRDFAKRKWRNEKYFLPFSFTRRMDIQVKRTSMRWSIVSLCNGHMLGSLISSEVCSFSHTHAHELKRRNMKNGIEISSNLIKLSWYVSTISNILSINHRFGNLKSYHVLPLKWCHFFRQIDLLSIALYRPHFSCWLFHLTLSMWNLCWFISSFSLIALTFSSYSICPQEKSSPFIFITIRYFFNSQKNSRRKTNLVRF